MMKNEIEHEALRVLLHAEAVLQKRINSMKSGGPLDTAKTKMMELRDAIALVKAELVVYEDNDTP
jgi:hypothetical protein